VTQLVGLDVGTTGVKALALSPEGDVLARAEESYELSTPHPGWAEQDPEDWWRAAERALAALGGQPTAIGLSGQMHGLVVLDDRDRVLRPAILWNDQRTEAECVEIEERVGLTRLIQLTGNRALTGFTAPKLLWLRRHEPTTYARVAHVLLPKDYVRLRLTGEHAIDAADASGTLLFDVAGRRWSQEMLEALELDPAWLPRALESPEILRRDGRRHSGRRGCRRSGGGGARRRRRPAGTGLGGARYVRRRVCGTAGLRRRSAGARARVLPRRSGRLARDGSHAVCGRLAALVA